MSDDIVTRLRELLDGPVPMTVERQDLREAADEIERLRAMCEQFASCAKSFGTKYGSDVVEFRINEKKFRKTWEKYKGGAW